MNKKILSWLESLMEEEALGLAPNPYQEAMKKNIANQATAQAVQEATQNVAKDIVDKGSRQMANTAQQFYEVSSAGDKRFSALYATFKPGTNIFGQDVSNRTIESVYQHGVKQGDWITNNNYKTGRPMSKAIITGNTEDDSYTQGYLPLWQEWAKQNPDLIEDLRTKSKGMQLSDKFARTRVSQARALTDILNTVPSNEELLKHLYTSSFFNKDTGQMPNNYSISRSQPKGFAYPELANLAPSKELLNAYKYNNLPWEEYTKQYNDYLERNKEQIINTINSLESDAILNCWEGSDNPKCHRHLLADWLNKNGKFNVEEFINKNKK